MIKNNFKLYVFIGDTDKSVAIKASKFSSDAFLLDYKNYKQFCQSTLTKDTTIYTSLGDLGKDLQLIITLCNLADTIFYSPPVQWSDKKVVDSLDPESSVQGLTEHILLLCPDFNKVKGLNIPNLEFPIPLVDHRKTDNPQLWIAGCSYSHGTGVDLNQRYGQLLADDLGLECSFLTRKGAAIDWATDQIIRSDIRPGDIVILGVTNIHRATYVHNNKLVAGINAKTYEIFPEIEKFFPIRNLLTENNFYQQIASIERVINFCNKSGARLLMIGLLSTLSSNLQRYLVTKKNFFSFPYNITYNKKNLFINYADYGTDNEHPGIIQHQQYKDFILKKLKED